jgi:exonuclease SbcC
MLGTLTLKNAYRHLSRTIVFEKGLTAISGPNESGKSVILEMIRYAFWGSAALRGSSDDYKKLEVTLTFGVNGVDYKVERIRGNAMLYRGTEVVATGVKMVNAKMIDIFGYGMSVFDVANSCNQGQIEDLGKKTPAERQKMVDQTIGLNFIDTLIKWVGEQSNVASKQAAALASVAIPPVVPTKAVDYTPSSDLSHVVDDLRKLDSERSQLIGWLSNKPTAPKDPGPSPSQFTLAELEQERKLRFEREMEIRQLDKEIERINQSIVTLRNRIRDAVVAPYSEEQLADMVVVLEHYAQCQQKARLEAMGSYTCPSCAHSWPVASDQLKAFSEVTPIEPPRFNVGDIKKWRTQLANQTDVADLQRQIDTAEAHVAATEKKKTPLVDSLAQMVNRVAEEQQLRDWESSRKSYQTQLDSYTAYQLEATVKEARLEALAGIPERLREQERLLAGARAYEQAMRAYEAAKALYDDTKAKLDDAEASAASFLAARDALKELKLRIKQHLVPSLSAVASRLLASMTGGVRSTIQIDDEFNIKVDGQTIQTLSGSAQAVANLAIRIGLGQVLTNKVFSVFMADEIDAAMDTTRAGHTAECLSNLSKSIGQIILVSHKKPNADHYIELTR